MKQTEINFMNMSDATIAGLDSESGMWENKSPIVNSINTIKAYRAELSGLSSDQASLTTQSATENLRANVSNMVNLTMDVVQRIRPYALVTSNKPLLAIIDFSKSDLEQDKQINSINKCKIVLNEASKHVEALGDYELTPELLETLKSAINGVSMLSGNRDAIIGSRKTATSGIPVLINKIRLHLEILDDLIPALLDDSKLIESYKNNRRIIDR